MEVTITSRNVEITQSLSEYLEKKLLKLKKHVHENVLASVNFSSERENQIVEIKLNDGISVFRGKKSATDIHTAIDLAVDSMEEQVKRQKERIRKKRVVAKNNRMDSLLDMPVEKIKRKTILLEPIPIEEAIYLLESSKNNYLPFVDIQDSSLIKILHQNTDGSYELIEPYLK